MKRPWRKGPAFLLLGGNGWREFLLTGSARLSEGKSFGKWDKLSPALNADHVHAALLSNAADTEYIAGLQWIISLEQLENTVELFVYPTTSH